MADDQPSESAKELRRIRFVLLGQLLFLGLLSFAVAMQFWLESQRPPVMPGQDWQAIQAVAAELRAIREVLKQQRNPVLGPNVISDNKAKVDAFMRAAEKGQVSQMEQLLKECVHVNDRDSESQTALMRAAAKGQAGVVTLLLDRKAIISEQDNLGQTAAIKAAANGQHAIILLLKDRFNQNELWSLRDKEGRIPFMHAALAGHADIVADLLYRGDTGQDNQGKTALMLAAERGHAKVVRTMVAPSVFKVSAAYLNLTDKNGKTALQLAEEKGHKAVVELLKK
jgi:ankyrin repeat protein